MGRQRIYSKRLYIVSIRQGISGFPGPYLPAIVTGALKRRDLLDSPTDRLPTSVSAATFRMEDGHVPEHQARGGIEAVTSFLAANPYAAAYWA